MYLYLPMTVRQHTEEIEQKLGDTCTETSLLLEVCLSSAFCLSYWSIFAASTVFPVEPYFSELPLHYQVCQDPCHAGGFTFHSLDLLHRTGLCEVAEIQIQGLGGPHDFEQRTEDAWSGWECSSAGGGLARMGPWALSPAGITWNGPQ